MAQRSEPAATADERLHVASIAAKALARITSADLLLDPKTFEVWFTYFCGTNQELAKDIDALEASGQVSPNSVKSVYDRHCSPLRALQQLVSAGERLRDEAHTVGTLLGTASEAVDVYDVGLRHAVEQLDLMEENKALNAVLTALLKSTKDIKRTNARMQAHLRKSENQVLQLQRNIELLQLESVTDPVTAVGNRKLFDFMLVRMVAEARTAGTALALIIADVDHFKEFNDQYGHQIGDEVLRLVATSLKQNVREGDLVLRFGGDEFAVLLPRTTLSEALAVSETIRAAVSRKVLLRRSTQEHLGRVSLSIGAAELADAVTPEGLVRAADACLLSAKGAGRNRSVG
ncbi:hypothetical protein CCR97_18605 [Rhodoplanes elegans]|uniref:diguanylate cyclase n=1 Tax=Rhodoplanes elegans TaxID=29408 RepID=A0A327KIZ7_9BRAD|nr:GGDEF domain-containing protein [Rhodoplanes elegans]MBK5960197.1 hypothetical protein [Rhodoplanes elegans]RAI38096.1 hypothetical protein CH338_13875 [Rhodoplanes elegans]